MRPSGASTSTRSPSADVRLLGIRHHGPGSARAVGRAFAADPPDVVLIEGPREADAIVALASHPDMQPPVTMLGYARDHLERAIFSPMASFSPEWVALQWAAASDVPVRHIDLALANTLALAAPDAGASQRSLNDDRPADPLALLAAAGGYDDPERWWEDVVEHRDGTSPFDAIAEAMTELRTAYEPDLVPTDPTEQRREAQMRTGIRAAVADGYASIAVVCGAWHVPALVEALDPRVARRDKALLRGMPKAKATITWVPWTHRRLATATGYGAGVASPGWYHHLFTHPGDDCIARWFAEAASVLRRRDYATSAADVVEATRLASSLGALRGRPLAGLAEVNDAARAVLGDGTDAPMHLLHDELVVGTLIGRVPDSTPMVPLARDLALQQRRARLRPEAGVRVLELDLRKPTDLARSHLLHRLRLLDVRWGRETESRGSAGTFRETWTLQWEPELEVRLIEMSALGTTVEAAARAAVEQLASATALVSELTAAIEQCLLADLPEPVEAIVALLSERVALDTDVSHAMAAMPSLARTLRYGDVRRTDAAALGSVARAMTAHIAAGLPAACAHIDDDAAGGMSQLVDDTSAALSLVGDDDMTSMFRRSLLAVFDDPRVAPALQGRATRMLADAGALAGGTVEGRVSRALSPGTAPAAAARFIEGFLGGSGLALAHDAELLAVVDTWMATLPGESFVDALPLLRRTFGTFEPAERRQIGERIRTGSAPATHLGVAALDPERVAAALLTIHRMIGGSDER